MVDKINELTDALSETREKIESILKLKESQEKQLKDEIAALNEQIKELNQQSRKRCAELEIGTQIMKLAEDVIGLNAVLSKLGIKLFLCTDDEWKENLHVSYPNGDAIFELDGDEWTSDYIDEDEIIEDAFAYLWSTDVVVSKDEVKKFLRELRAREKKV